MFLTIFEGHRTIRLKQTLVEEHHTNNAEDVEPTINAQKSVRPSIRLTLKEGVRLRPYNPTIHAHGSVGLNPRKSIRLSKAESNDHQKGSQEEKEASN